LNTSPTITPKQHTILQLLYRYRFLNRIQVQQLLKHKDKRRVVSWLKDLRDKGYIEWKYDSTDFIAKSRPAIYYLALNGIRRLRADGTYPVGELRKRYKEASRSQAFIDRCILIANSSLALQAKSSGKLQYQWYLPADLKGSESSPLSELEPHLYFKKFDDGEITSYTLETIEPNLPRYSLRKRLDSYLDILANEWDSNREPLPIALFVCATTADLIYVKRRIKHRQHDDAKGKPKTRITTLADIKKFKVTGMIWEEV
jgi:hypothetical protein